MRAAVLGKAILLSFAATGFVGIEAARAEMVMVANYVPVERKNKRFTPIRAGETVCTQDVKACPGGSYVGRNPEDGCKFKACPTNTALN